MVLALYMQPARVVAHLVLRMINTSALQVIQRLPGQRQCPLAMTEHLAQDRLLFQLVRGFNKKRTCRCCGPEGSRTASTERGGFQQRLVLAAFFHQLDELDHITRTGRALAAKATISIGLGVDLQARAFIGVEGAMQPVVFVGLQTVMVQNSPDGQLRLDFGYLHEKNVLTTYL